MAADVLLEAGKCHAGNGNYEQALRSFKKACQLDKSITIDPSQAAGRLVAEYLVASGIRKAFLDDLQAAFADFSQAGQYPRLYHLMRCITSFQSHSQNRR